MRLLFTFVGNRGHLDPLLPIARAARAGGHAVAFCGRPWMVPRVEALGFACFPAGGDAGLVPRQVPLGPLERDPEMRWGVRKPRERLTDLLPVIDRWHPDAIVWEETDIGAAVAAERARVVHASVIVTAAGTFFGPEVVRSAVEELRAEQGLPPDPELAMLRRHLVLAPVPPSFRDPAAPLPGTAFPIRPAVLDEQVEQMPAWMGEPSGRPLVYLTLGSVFPLESGDLFARAIAGIRDLPVDLVVTVGAEFDRATLGPQPANVRVEPWVPQAALLPRCYVVVSHGGSGTVVGALACGVPLVVLPIGADQPHNGDRCEALGVGRVLDSFAATPHEIGDAVSTVLARPDFRAAAGTIAREARSLPPAASAVPLLEGVVTRSAER